MNFQCRYDVIWSFCFVSPLLTNEERGSIGESQVRKSQIKKQALGEPGEGGREEVWMNERVVAARRSGIGRSSASVYR